jgi:hypothetical protein
VAVWSGYWYGRNLWLTGTPLYPLGFTGATNRLGAYYEGVWQTTLLGNGRPEVLPLALDAVYRTAGPCQLAAVLALPAVLGWLVVSGFLAPAGPERASRWALALLTAGAGAVLVVTPFAVETEPGTLNHLRMGYGPVRYGQCFLALGVMALSVCVSDLAAGLERLAPRSAPRLAAALSALPAAALAGVLAYQVVRLVRGPAFAPGSVQDVALVGLNAALLALALRLAWRAGPWPRRGALAVGAALAVAAAFGGVAELSSRWHRDFVRHYDRMFSTRLFQELGRLDPAARRLCVLEYRYYPFFGPGRQSPVCRPARVPSADWLVDYVRETGVDVLVVTRQDLRAFGSYRGAGSWVQDRPDVFQPVVEDPAWLVVRVHPDPPTVARPTPPGGRPVEAQE